MKQALLLFTSELCFRTEGIKQKRERYKAITPSHKDNDNNFRNYEEKMFCMWNILNLQLPLLNISWEGRYMIYV